MSDQLIRATISVNDRSLDMVGNVQSYLEQFAGWNAGDDMIVSAARQIPPGSVFIDVGANIGIVTCTVAASRPDIKVIAIEPSPGNVACLKENICTNELGNVQVIHAAVGAGHGSVQVNDNGPWSQIGSGDMVELITLDDFADQPVSLIKIDVEGWEPDVLSGAEKLLTQHQPHVVMEWNTWCLLTLGKDPMRFAQEVWDRFNIEQVWSLGKQHDLPKQATDIVHDNIVKFGSVSDLVMRPRGGE